MEYRIEEWKDAGGAMRAKLRMLDGDGGTVAALGFPHEKKDDADYISALEADLAAEYGGE